MLSFTLTSIIETFVRVKKAGKIICLAPTGRAAKRMTEQTGREARTIHSYLKIQPGKMESDIEVNADLLIVDESSMLDLDVAYALIKSLASHTAIIFIGDTNQLPSIGAGNILSDMIESKVISSVELEVVYRQAEDSTISKNANKILNENTKLLIEDDFEFIRVSSPKEAQDRILYELKRSTETYGVVESCVLTPLRRNKDTSVNLINPLAQSLINPPSSHKTEIIINGKTFRVEDKVMITRNSGIAANGDVGIITNIDVANKEVTIDLGYGKPIVLNGDELNTIDLAYSMTIHKSQGSEYDCVIIVVMDEHASLLQKNLIYTAITRAKKKIILIGQNSAIAKSISGKLEPRRTLLADFLKALA